jgi:hypothetical protein
MPRRYYDAATGQMDFGLALEALMRGDRVTRLAWAGATLRLEQNTGAEALPEKFLVLRSAAGEPSFWHASQTDLFACDWKQIYDNSRL